MWPKRKHPQPPLPPRHSRVRTHKILIRRDAFEETLLKRRYKLPLPAQHVSDLPFNVFHEHLVSAPSVVLVAAQEPVPT